MRQIRHKYRFLNLTCINNETDKFVQNIYLVEYNNFSSYIDKEIILFQGSTMTTDQLCHSILKTIKNDIIKEQRCISLPLKFLKVVPVLLSA